MDGLGKHTDSSTGAKTLNNETLEEMSVSDLLSEIRNLYKKLSVVTTDWVRKGIRQRIVAYIEELENRNLKSIPKDSNDDDSVKSSREKYAKGESDDKLIRVIGVLEDRLGILTLSDLIAFVRKEMDIYLDELKQRNLSAIESLENSSDTSKNTEVVDKAAGKMGELLE